MNTTLDNVWQPHPLDVLRPGDVRLTWCSKSGDREWKLWTGYKWICLHCHPEQDPRRDTPTSMED